MKTKVKFTIEDLQRLKKEGKIRGWIDKSDGAEIAEKRHKYGAKKVEIDGITFDSIKEGRRYRELKMLEAAGLITDLKLQVPFELNEGGTHSVKYIADFQYIDVMTSARITEDAKGYRTKEYLKKRRLMLKIHNIKIKEV